MDNSPPCHSAAHADKQSRGWAVVSQEVPFAAFDTLAGICGLRAQEKALLGEIDSLVETAVGVMTDFALKGDHAALLEAMQGFRVVYGSGWARRLKTSGLPDVKSVEATLRGVCNDGEGRWRGGYPLEQTASRPARGTWVVYQLLNGDELLYIGSTGAFAERIKAHGRTKEFDSWRAAECQDERHCRQLEAALIDHYRPPLNRMIPEPKLVLR